MIHSENQRFELFKWHPIAADVEFFWGYRSFIEWAISERLDVVPDDLQVVIADKGFINRSNTVFAVNRQWGRLGAFAVNPRPHPLGDILREPIDREGVLELGQDAGDFSYMADSEGYDEWLNQWPDRYFRPHPKVGRSKTSLAEDLEAAGHVVGLNTSALITASVAGLSVSAFGEHSMAKGVDSCRLERLSWLRSIEFDRRDPAQVGAIKAVLADPARAGVCPEAEIQTQASPPKSQKTRGKKQQARRVRGKRGDQSGEGSGEPA